MPCSKAILHAYEETYTVRNNKSPLAEMKGTRAILILQILLQHPVKTSFRRATLIFRVEKGLLYEARSSAKCIAGIMPLKAVNGFLSLMSDTKY